MLLFLLVDEVREFLGFRDGQGGLLHHLGQLFLASILLWGDLLDLGSLVYQLEVTLLDVVEEILEPFR